MLKNAARTKGFRAFATSSLATAKGGLTALLLALAVVLGATPAAQAARHAEFVIDAKSGQVLHSLNADSRVYPASLTKMMTLYKVFEALQNGRWTLNTRLRMTRHAAGQPPSKLGLPAGETLSVRKAILALTIISANDVAAAIAENYAGKEWEFARQMTATAQRLGMTNTNFRNASGLPHRGQYTTARDMAKLAKALLRDFPQYYHFFSQTSFEFHGVVHKTHNELLLSYTGADGFKTGYIRASGFNLVTSAVRGDRRLIGVVFGGRSARARNLEMARVLDASFGTRPAVVVADNRAQTETEARETADSHDADKAEDESATKVVVFDKHSRWGIQVGAYAQQVQAQQVAMRAMHSLPNLLEDGVVSVVPLTKKNGSVLHRARVYGLSRHEAYRACRALENKHIPCMELRAPRTVEVAALDDGL